jgi:Type IV secretion system pilin
MNKILLLVFSLLVITIGFSSYTVSNAADTPTKGATLNSFNPFSGDKDGIKCLYYFSGSTDPKNNISNPTIKNGNATGTCTKETGLLNRVESLMFIIAPSFAVLGIMLGGYKMMQDGYDAKGEGMKTIRGSILGMVIILSAFFVRNVVYSFFNSTFTGGELTIASPIVNDIIKILRDICYNVLVPIGSPIAVGFVIWGGYQLITAGGDTKKIDAGTKTIRNAIIGFLVIIFAAAIVSISQNLLAGFYGTLKP